MVGASWCPPFPCPANLLLDWSSIRRPAMTKCRQMAWIQISLSASGKRCGMPSVDLSLDIILNWSTSSHLLKPVSAKTRHTGEAVTKSYENLVKQQQNRGESHTNSIHILLSKIFKISKGSLKCVHLSVGSILRLHLKPTKLESLKLGMVFWG